jgi:hypothetical protein
MKMYDAGEMMSKSFDGPVTAKEGKDRKYYPHLDMDSNQFPEISKMKVGEKCMLMIEVKPTRYSINEREGQEAKSSMCFEVMRVGMAEDQEAGMEKEEKMDKMVDKMYPKKKED